MPLNQIQSQPMDEVSSFTSHNLPSLSSSSSSSSTLHHLYNSSSHIPHSHTNMCKAKTQGDKGGMLFEDHFPAMLEKLGAEGFMDELRKGFQVLMDSEKQLITFQSLKRNAALLLGLQLKEDELLQSMLNEGDLDGDGCLNLQEFCVLMLRLSPNLMNRATDILFQDFD